MKRMSIYIKSLEIKGIVSKRELQGSVKYLESKGNSNHYIDAELMSPGEEYNVMASEVVKLNTLNKDLDSESLFDANSFIETDRLLSIKVKEFSIENVESLNYKNTYTKAIALVELTY